MFDILEGDTYRRDCGWAEDEYPPQRDNIFATIENFRGRYISPGLWLGGGWISSAAKAC